jgi:uncharacterized protein
MRYDSATMHSALDQKRIEIQRICQRFGIQKLEVFGSAARGFDFDPQKSDADFLVEFAPSAKRGLGSYFALKSELETLLGRGVDLVEPRSVQNPYVLAGINSHREVVYAA